MNYIEQINGFWNKSEDLDLTGLDIAVYMSLLKYCNRLNWLNPFVCHWDIACQTSKVSKNAYYKSIERLNEFGFIKYEKGVKNTNQKPKIFILELTNNKGTIREQRGNKEGTTREQQGNLYKHLNNLNNKQINIILDYYNSLPSDFLDEKLAELMPLENIDKIYFDEFWDLYDKKVSRDNSEKKWNKLSEKDKELIMQFIPKYKAYQPDKKFRKDPLTFFNNKTWLDEIPNKNGLSVIPENETAEEKDLRIRIESFKKIKVH